MKPTFNSYIAAVLVALVPFFSSCEKDLVEPMLPTTEATQAAARLSNEPTELKNNEVKFQHGNYIILFVDDSTTNLVSNQDIENLTEEIAGKTDVAFHDFYNFEGFKGTLCYLKKQDAYKFLNDGRVLSIEMDSPIMPAEAL